MKKLQRISFHLHWITLGCFLLPFFYDSCSKRPDEVADNSAIVVPVDVAYNIKDSIAKTHANQDIACTIKADTTAETPVGKKDEFTSRTFVEKHPTFKPIVMPDENTFTGLATIINSISFVQIFAPTIVALLLVIGLFAKLIDENATKTFLLLEICASLFLFISSPYLLFDYKILWGYWLCAVCMSILTLLDAYIIYKQSKLNEAVVKTA